MQSILTQLIILSCRDSPKTSFELLTSSDPMTRAALNNLSLHMLNMTLNGFVLFRLSTGWIAMCLVLFEFFQLHNTSLVAL